MKHIDKNINDLAKKIDVLKKDIILEIFKYRKDINPFKNLNISNFQLLFDHQTYLSLSIFFYKITRFYF